MESKGRLTSDVPSKHQLDNNVFQLQTAPDGSYDRPIEDLSKFLLADFLKDVKSKIMGRSLYGVKALNRIFKAMDTTSNGKLDVDDFRWGLMDFGISITKDEAAECLSNFNADGCVSYAAFLDAFKTPMNAGREAIVKKAYETLAANSENGSVCLDDIAKAYDANGDPDVFSGKRSEEDSFMEFLSLFDTQVKESVVSYEEFRAYFSDIGALVEDDGHFEKGVKTSFKLE